MTWINHFRTYLLNRKSTFFEDSLFPVYTDPEFIPSPRNRVSRELDRILFGGKPDESIIDYRFFQFLRLINACQLHPHVIRQDSRETYKVDQYNFDENDWVRTEVLPQNGLQVIATDVPAGSQYLRKRFSVMCHPSNRVPITVFNDSDRTQPVRLTRKTDFEGSSQELGLTFIASREGSWDVDYRRPSARGIVETIYAVNDLENDFLTELFSPLRDVAPEYEKGFRYVTDVLHRFCMVLFALAYTNEELANNFDLMDRNIDAPADSLSPTDEGTLYYGSHTAESLNMSIVKRNLTGMSVNSRKQMLTFPIPDRLAYVWFAWPARFGLPVNNRILVNNLVNTAWEVSYDEDTVERYVLLRSTYQARTDTPIEFEIL